MPSDTSALATEQPPPEILNRLEWLMFFRVILVTLFLGSTVVFRLADHDILTSSKHNILVALIVGTYVLTIIYVAILRAIRRHYEQFALVQLFGDLVISSVLVALTGGTESFFLVLFPLCVLSASILLYRKGAMYTMVLATALIVLHVVRESLGWWMPSGPVRDDALLGVLLSGLTNVSAVFLVGMLAGYLSEQARDAGRRFRDASRDLEALRALNGHIITSIQSGLVSYTLDHRIIFFNPAAGRITGFEPEAVLYAKVTEIFTGIEGYEDPSEQARWESPFRRPDGKTRELGFSLSPLLDGNGRHQGYILIMQDLTPLREMEESVRRSERFAGIGKMAAGIAHEIRNPLASMSGSIQMLSQSGSLDDTGNRLMRIVLRETDRLNSLVTEFLQFARPNPPEFEQIHLRHVLDEMILVFRYLHFSNTPDSRPDLDVNLRMESEIQIQADPRQLRQVFWNLLNNSVQAMPDGGTIDVAVEKRAREVEVQVLDQGVGIPVDRLDRIFDPFYSTKKDGTGLGLALVHRIIEEHEGRIHVVSSPGEGTRFSVILPIKQPERQQQGESRR